MYAIRRTNTAALPISLHPAGKLLQPEPSNFLQHFGNSNILQQKFFAISFRKKIRNPLIHSAPPSASHKKALPLKLRHH